MPRWKSLPDELDPQLREFTQQLRRLVDHSGLSVSAVADRTGYSKTSWERYLGGRLLAPKGAVVALAEVTGTHPVHLTTLWELAERAWSRSETRHDATMDALRISQARAAPTEPETAAGEPGSGTGKAARSAAAALGIAGPAGVVPSVPPRPAAARTPNATGDVQASRGGAEERGVSSGTGSRASGADSWGVAGHRASPETGGRQAAAPGAFGPAPDMPGTLGPGTPGGPPGGNRPDTGGRPYRRRLVMFLAGVAGALAVIAPVFFLTGGNGNGSTPSPEPAATSASALPELPSGVKCGGASCTGKDPEKMGCGGTLARSTSSVTVGTTLVEVRYSRTCGTAWARITRAARGDTVEVSAGGPAGQTGSVTGAADTDAYTPMLAVKDPAAAKACVTTVSGRKGCTK
ncbi:XRE family transcriptional regulator [Streptomyces sp. NPDC046931]|uniref:XRE family transcriptional regulator n=1 Tax=Streptomyces sp. NPDC046931 TaxID=3154806 RepID=UPI0033D4A2DD